EVRRRPPAGTLLPLGGGRGRRDRPGGRRRRYGLGEDAADASERGRACRSRRARPRGRPMRALPVPGAASLSAAARRTRIVRGALAIALVVLVLLAAFARRHPTVGPPGSLPVRSGDMVVLDLSASIGSDPFSRIGETLRRLVASHGRYGLVVFSNVAYEALPPGSPASAFEPLIRYFTAPA